MNIITSEKGFVKVKCRYPRFFFTVDFLIIPFAQKYRYRLIPRIILSENSAKVTPFSWQIPFKPDIDFFEILQIPLKFNSVAPTPLPMSRCVGIKPTLYQLVLERNIIFRWIKIFLDTLC